MCCVHRRFVCEDCVADPTHKPAHLTCTIKNYSDWVRDAYHETPVKCTLCSEDVTDEKAFVRLACFCLFHAECLTKYLTELDVSIDEIKCPRCSALIYSKLHHKRSILRTKLAEVLDKVTLKHPLPKPVLDPNASTASSDSSDHERKASQDSAQGGSTSSAPAQSPSDRQGEQSSSTSSAAVAAAAAAAAATSTMQQHHKKRHAAGGSGERSDSVSIDVSPAAGDDEVLSDDDHEPKPRRLPPRPLRGWVKGGSGISIRTIVLVVMLLAIIGIGLSPFLISSLSSAASTTAEAGAAKVAAAAAAADGAGAAAGGAAAAAAQ